MIYYICVHVITLDHQVCDIDPSWTPVYNFNCHVFISLLTEFILIFLLLICSDFIQTALKFHETRCGDPEIDTHKVHLWFIS